LPEVLPQLLVGIAILTCFLAAFRVVDGVWAPPSLLFIFGFFSSTFLYSYSLTLAPVFYPTVAYWNFEQGLFLATLCFIALLAGYLIYGTLSARFSTAPAMPLRYLRFTSFKGANILGIVILLCALYTVYYTAAAGGFSSIRGENSYLTDADVGIGNRIGFIVGYAAPPLILAVYVAAQSFDDARRHVILFYAWSAIILLVGMTLFSLNRQLAVTLVLYIALIYHYRVRPLRKAVIASLFFGLVAIQIARGLRTLNVPMAQLSPNEIIAFVADAVTWDSLVLVITAVFTGIAGWDVFTNVLDIVPAREDFHRGATYLSSLLGLAVPRSLGLSSYEDVTPSLWYVNAYAPGTTNNGFDFSMLGEAYMNFGNFMPLVFVMVGALVAHLSKLIRTSNSPARLFAAVIILVSLTFSLRSDSNVLFKSVFYYTVPALFVVLLVNSWLAIRARTGALAERPAAE
jgi:hypothetical protein